MTDESKTQPDACGSPKPSFLQPARQDFGDKTDRPSRRTDPTETEDKDMEDAGEGHKGPRVDATRPGSDAPRARRDQLGR